MKKGMRQQRRINSELYVNMETGETLGSEVGNATSVNIPTGLVKITSSHFRIVDDNASRRLQGMFSDIEYGRISKLFLLCSGTFNALKDENGSLHTKESLMAFYGLSRNTYDSFFRKLMAEGVIALFKARNPKGRKITTAILLNPFIARCGAMYNSDCTALFYDFSKPLP